MTPQSHFRRQPLTPARVEAVGTAVGVTLSGATSGTCQALLPLVLELARAPLPQHWEPFSGGAKRVGHTGGTLKRGGSSGGASSAAAAAEAAPLYKHSRSGKVQAGHPMAPQLTPIFKQLEERGSSKNFCPPTHSWVCFATVDGEGGGRAAAGIYWHNFTTGRRSDELLPADVLPSLTKCVLPLSQGEPSAALLADAAASCWSGKKGRGLLESAKEDLWHSNGAAAARAAALAAQPCPLPVILQMSLYLGVDPAKHPHLLWLAQAALTPQLPAGWLCCTSSRSKAADVSGVAATSGSEPAQSYYWHAACGLVQWEHPHVAFLGGVARRLVREA